MPLRVHLTIHPEGHEGLIVDEGEVASLQSQGLLVGEPEPVEDPAQPALPMADKEN
jgi:hypothetical protein